MKLNQKLINQFNKEDTILVVSKYPYKNIAKSYHGVACYTQNQLREISKRTGKKFVVLIQDEYQRKIEKDGDNILLIPSFNSSKFMFAQIIKKIRTFNQVSIIHIHSEFYTSGDPIQMALVIPFLAILKLLSKDIYYTAHNVIENFDFIASHLGKKQSDPVLKILEKSVPIYYFALSRLTTKIIALDPEVKKKLNKYALRNSAYLSLHWIYPNIISSYKRKKYRKEFGLKTNDFVVMNFGFVTRYKGSDWLIDAVNYVRNEKKQKNIHLILAGGKAASQIGKKHYENYYGNLVEKVAKSNGMVLTGFVSKSEVLKYFATADLIVLPYRGILGASGSWAQTMAYQKPFLLSKDLENYLEAEDIKEAMQKIDLKKTDLLFARNKQSFEKIINDLSKNPKKLKKMAKLSKIISEKRSPEYQLSKDIQLYTPKLPLINLQLTRASEIWQKIQPAFAK